MVTGRPASSSPYTRPGARRPQGYAYLALLFAVVLIGAALGGTATVWHTMMQRERERQLLWVGNQYRLAIQRYTEARPQPGTAANGANIGAQGLQLGNVTNGGTVGGDPATGTAAGGAATGGGTAGLPFPRPGTDGDYGISINPDGTLPPQPVGGGEFGSGLTGGLGAGTAALNAFGEGSGNGAVGGGPSNGFGGGQQGGGRSVGTNIGGANAGGPTVGGAITVPGTPAATRRGGPSRYPPNLAVLLADPRFPQLHPYLRQLYPDPITGKVDWVPILAPNGGVMGVRSKSTDHPFKIANFRPKDILFTAKEKYSDWKFVFAPTNANQGAQPAPTASQQQNFGPAPGAPLNPQGPAPIPP
jgi:type II secretory pathway pseudopilin PulG